MKIVAMYLGFGLILIASIAVSLATLYVAAHIIGWILTALFYALPYLLVGYVLCMLIVRNR